MDRDRSAPPQRIDIWKNAAWLALVSAAVVLVLVKLMTGIMLIAAFLLAVAVFMIAFGFAIRLSPRRYQ